MHSLTMRPFLLRLMALMLCALPGLCRFSISADNDIARQRVDKIKNSSDKYYFGEGSGITNDEADAAALAALSRSINAKISALYKEQLTDDSESMTQTTTISSLVSVNNAELIILDEEPNATVFRYVLKSDVDDQFAAMADKIAEYTAEGLRQEQRLAISSALRYYNWAYNIARAHPDQVKITVDGENSYGKGMVARTHRGGVGGTASLPGSGHRATRRT